MEEIPKDTFPVTKTSLQSSSSWRQAEGAVGSPAYVVISSAYLNNWSVRVACRRHSGNYLNKQANNFSFIKSKFLNP